MKTLLKLVSCFVIVAMLSVLSGCKESNEPQTPPAEPNTTKSADAPAAQSTVLPMAQSAMMQDSNMPMPMPPEPNMPAPTPPAPMPPEPNMPVPTPPAPMPPDGNMPRE